MSAPFLRRSDLERSGGLIVELEAARNRLLKTDSVSRERSALEQLIAHLHRELAACQAQNDLPLGGRA